MFPLLYHTHHSRHTEDIPFWLALARQSKGDILEMGCGTGRVYIPLLQALSKTQRRVIGIDTDASMLRFLQAQLTAPLIHSALLIQEDMSAFHFGMTFDLIILPCNTFSTLTGEERRRTLSRVEAHLAAGGLFAVSIPNPAALADLPGYGEPELEETFSHPADGTPVQVSSYWKKEGTLFDLYWQYDHILPSGDIEQITSRTQHKLLDFQTYLNELQRTGFAKSTIYGDFDFSAYTNESPALILLAQKNG